MKQTLNFKFILMLIGFAMALILLNSCSHNGYGCHGRGKIMTRVVSAGHKCKWQLCPYKDVVKANYKAAVLKYTDSPGGSDAVCIDLLHLEYPTLEYDQLEEKLFSAMK